MLVCEKCGPLTQQNTVVIIKNSHLFSAFCVWQTPAQYLSTRHVHFYTIQFAFEVERCALLCPWDSLGKNTAVGCPALLQGIFSEDLLDPGINSVSLVFPVMQAVSLPLVPPGKLSLCEWKSVIPLKVRVLRMDSPVYFRLQAIFLTCRQSSRIQRLK